MKFKKKFPMKLNIIEQLPKKLKKPEPAILHNSGIFIGTGWTVLSSEGLATALTGIGITTGAPLGIVGALCGLAAAGLTATSEKFAKKRIIIAELGFLVGFGVRIRVRISIWIFELGFELGFRFGFRVRISNFIPVEVQHYLDVRYY